MINRSKKMRVLITGGTGYIGSHTALELISSDYEVVLFDNGVNSSREVVDVLNHLTGKSCTLIRGDLNNPDALDACFNEGQIDAVIHFAALKSVPESVSMPLQYYHNNFSGTLQLLQAMEKHHVRQLVFSSTAAVYGPDNKMPVAENGSLAPINPYGSSKKMVEQVLRDLHESDSRWNISVLRYFNPVGAHVSGLLGESPKGVPSNLMPCIVQVADGTRPHLLIFGGDYPTYDGTGIRDYLHVVDLAKGHTAALQHLEGFQLYNLGTGRGHSVLEVIRTFERVNAVPIPYEIVDRRSGDMAVCYADPQLAEQKIGWKAVMSMDDMCRDSWRSQLHKGTL